MENSASNTKKKSKIDNKILQLMYGTTSWSKNSSFLGISNKDVEVITKEFSHEIPLCRVEFLP